MKKRERIKLATGIYQDATGISIMASVGSGKNIISTESREPLGTDIKLLIAKWHEAKAKLSEEQALAGGAPATRGLLASDVKRYLGAAQLTDRLREERKYELAWWCKKFPKRTRSSFLKKGGHIELLAALNSLKASASTKDKYRTALSHLFTVLDGKNAPNPFREVPRFDTAEPEQRDQPYELIDAIFAHMRDTGQRGESSRTKAFLRVEAFAPVTRAELGRMTKANVHWDKMEITTPGRHKGLGSAGLRKPITPEALEAFKAFDAADCWLRDPSNSSILRTFRRARNAAIAELKVTRPDLDLSSAMPDRKGKGGMRPYDLRHSFARMVYEKTGDLAMTGALLGHAPGSPMTLRYAKGAVPTRLKMVNDQLQAAMEARPKYIKPTPPKPRLVKKAS